MRDRRDLLLAAFPPELAGLDHAPPAAWLVATTGVGAVTAAVETARLIALHRPGRVLFVGTCGAYDARLSVGESPGRLGGRRGLARRAGRAGLPPRRRADPLARDVGAPARRVGGGRPPRNHLHGGRRAGPLGGGGGGAPRAHRRVRRLPLGRRAGGRGARRREPGRSGRPRRVEGGPRRREPGAGGRAPVAGG